MPIHFWLGVTSQNIDSQAYFAHPEYKLSMFLHQEEKTEKFSGREPQVFTVNSLQHIVENAEKIWMGHNVPMRQGQSLTVSKL